MTREEAKKYADVMTYEQAISNLLHAKNVPYRKATFIKVNELLDELEQEPFMNKPCISSKVCEHDKEVVLDKIRAEIESINLLAEYTRGDIKRMALTIIDKYKTESEE